MMKQRQYCRDIVIGSTLESQTFVIKDVADCGGRDVRLLLSDSSGELMSSCTREQYEPSLFVKGAVLKVAGIVVADGIRPFLRIKKVEIATEYNPVELYNGLTPQQEQLHKTNIKNMLCENYITHEAYLVLCKTLLCDSVLDKLAVLPATLSWYGKYAGGALCSTATVATMVGGMASAYQNSLNPYCDGRGFDCSRLYAAALLRHCAMPYYIENIPPFRRNNVLVDYPTLLRDVLVSTVRDNCINLSVEEVDILWADMVCSMNERGYSKPFDKEGVILRTAVFAYAECDMLDYAVSQLGTGYEGNHAWDKELGRYLYLPKNKEVM